MRAVRALVLDAEMRCALDEREVEFLWAAPTQIYGSNGWRQNNGSISERTPYPTGNFKMAVRHGGEGNAKDVLNRRKLLLSSISLGRAEADAAEAEAAAAGDPHSGCPIRLPALDEMRRHKPSAGGNGGGLALGSGVLEPARAVVGASGELREFGSLWGGDGQRPLPSEGSPGRDYPMPRRPDGYVTPRTLEGDQQRARAGGAA